MPEEVHALVRDGGHRDRRRDLPHRRVHRPAPGELLALKWRDVDFAGCVVRVRASFSQGHLTTPKSGKVRAVPMAPNVARALDQLSRRERFTAEDDLVFCSELGGYMDGSALRRRYYAALDCAGLRRLRFHDLRHTFRTRMIGKADIVRVKEWMGHASVSTTMRYLHYAPRPEDAAARGRGVRDRHPGRRSAGRRDGLSAVTVRGAGARRASVRRRSGRSAGGGRSGWRGGGRVQSAGVLVDV
jgi:integrase